MPATGQAGSPETAERGGTRLPQSGSSRKSRQFTRQYYNLQFDNLTNSRTKVQFNTNLM